MQESVLSINKIIHSIGDSSPAMVNTLTEGQYWSYLTLMGGSFAMTAGNTVPQPC